jgi:hypothetical protein
LILRTDGSVPVLQKWQREPDNDIEEVTFDALREVLGDFEAYYLCDDFDVFVSECPEPDAKINEHLSDAMLHMRAPAPHRVRGAAVIHVRQGCRQLELLKA